MTSPISSADIGARTAAASHRGGLEERERARAERMGDAGPRRGRRVSTAPGAVKPSSGDTSRLDTPLVAPDHRIEMRLCHGLATALLGAGLGVQVFLSFLLAPATFRAVDRPVAVQVMEGVFPGYYGFGLVTLALTLVLAVTLALREPGPLRWGAVALLVVTLAGTVYAGRVLLPQAHAARLRAQAAPAGDLAPLEFSRLHRRSVAVNIAVFATGAIALVLHLAAGAGGAPPQGQTEPATRVASQRAGSNSSP